MSLISMLARVLKMTLIQAVQNRSRCKARENGRAQAYSIRTSSEAIGAQRSRWTVFNSLLPLIEKIDLT